MKKRVGAVLVVVAGLLVSCRSAEATRETRAEAGAIGPASIRVDPALLTSGRIAIAPAGRRPMNGDLRIPAEVVPSESAAADIGALVAGRVGSIDVREGDAVKRGQLLASVDSPEAARMVADAIRARSRVLGATHKLERQLALEQERATSPAAVDEARMELAIADADAAAARTLLSSLGIPEPPTPGQGVLPARVPLRSPIDGVVVTRTVDLGAPVSPEKTLFRVQASDRVVVEARWTDATTPPPPNGTAVSLLMRGGDGRAACPGHVFATLALVDDKTRARRVRVAPDGPCAMLVPGGYVDAWFTSASVTKDAASALAVPKDAVVDVRGASTVFVALAEKGVFAPRVVRTGRATSEDVVVEEGLAEGDLVVVAGAVLLKGELLRSELAAQ